MISHLSTLWALPTVGRLAAALYTPPADWAARRDAQIREIVQHAARATRFYPARWQAAGVDPASIRGADDLPRLPVIERLEWRLAPPEDTVAPGWRATWQWSNTGGTTRDPLHMPYTLRDDSRMVAAILALLRFHGVPWADLFIPPAGPLPPALKKLRRVGKLIYLPLRLGPAEMQSVLDAGLFPYARALPSPVWRAVVRANRAGHKLPPLRLLVCGAEVMTETARRTLAAGLGCRVINHFGSTDSGQIGVECRAGNLHLAHPSLHVEISAGDRPARPGEAGEVVATSFVTHARPAVRVRTGDCAAWSAEPCACGSPVPRFAFVAGRTIDRVARPDGQYIYLPQVEQALAPLGAALWGWQAEQTAPSHVIVRLSLADPTAGAEAARPGLQALFAGQTVEIALTDDFRIEQSKKTRAVIGLEPG